MPLRLRTVLTDHRDRAFLAFVLAASSCAGLAMLAFRVFYSGNSAYAFMPWNLFLAWVPLGLAAALHSLSRARPGARLTLWALAVLWLLFFPNAPYLLTEFVHLDPHYRPSQRPLALLAGVSPARSVPVWYDAVMILTFAWTGLLLAFVSLHVVHRFVCERLGRRWSWAMVVAVLGLSGFGVSLGRFQRWNSWDLFSRPMALLGDVAGRVLNPLDHPRTTAVTILFGSFLLLAYLSVLALASLRPGERRPTA
jgi:uncharacterized membrane protein